jgi:sigma-B regulation protein RsbU (phosphoserine phosphatase)
MITLKSKRALKVSLFTKNSDTENAWRADLRSHLKVIEDGRGIQVVSARDEIGEITFIDARKADWRDWVKGLSRSGKSVVLVLEQSEIIPDAECLSDVDDLIVSPFRTAEVISVLRHHHQKLAMESLMEEASLVASDMNAANSLLERILMEKTPKRFSGIKGIQVMSRHLSGLRPGGDYFDVFESEKKDFVNFLLVDSSNYGISSALLGMILSSSARIASSAESSPSHWVRAIFTEIKTALGDTGHFSIFFGRLNRRDFSLHYQLFGSIESYLMHPTGKGSRLRKHGGEIKAESEPGVSEEFVIQLEPKDRLVILSDGFVSGAGGDESLERIFCEKQEQDPFTLVNELAFQIKSKLSPGEVFPGEDCSAVVIDIEKRVLRLAPVG